MTFDEWEKYKKDNCNRFGKLMAELEASNPKEMAEARKWAKEFLESQEQLPYDMQKVLMDNINDLYLE